LSEPRSPIPCKLVMSIFAGSNAVIQEAMDRVSRAFGSIQMASSLLRFDFTSYYEPEFGKDLVRRFVVFSGLVDQADLKGAKLEAMGIEKAHSKDGRRRFNLDPGILTLERLVLATRKNFTHRIYLGSGVFADLTLVFRKGSFRPLEWTYPDYATKDSICFWNRVRGVYHKELKRREYLA